MHTRLGFEMLLIAVINQRVEATRRFEIDMTPASTIPAIRSAKGNIFFPPERDASAAARTGLHIDFGLVEKFHEPSLRRVIAFG